jgi:hypothetical protein
MIKFTRPCPRVTTAAAALLGAAIFASPLFAAQADSNNPPATHQVLASAASSATMTSSAPEAPGPDAVEARIKELHRRLHITDAQKTQWDNLTSVMRDNAQAMLAIEKQRAADSSSMNAVDVVKSYESVIEAHEDGMKKFIPAFQALYDSMSDSQKQIADSMFRSKARAAAKQTAENK